MRDYDAPADSALNPSFAASGDGNQAMQTRQVGIKGGKAEVAKLDFTQEEVDSLKRKLLDLTEAVVTVRGPGRDADGRCIYITVPNVGIQLAATVKALEFGVGKPKQMLEIQDNPGRGRQASGPHELGRLLAEHPDVAAKVIETMKEGLRFSQAIPVEAVKREIPAKPAESESDGSPSEKP